VSNATTSNNITDIVTSIPSNATTSNNITDIVTAIPSITAFDKGGLKVTFNFEKDSSYANTIRVTLTALNSASQQMNDFLFQAAVPKVYQAVL